MATLKTLDVALLDLRDTLTRELQFSQRAQAQISAAFNTLAEAVDHAEATVNNAFAERNRSLEMALGIAPPQQQEEGQQEQMEESKAAEPAEKADEP
eukprot:gene17926-17770_t